MNEIVSMTKYFWIKFLLTIPISYFIFTEEHFLIAYILLLMIGIDTVLGIWVAIKYKIFISHKLGRLGNKISKYALGMMSMYLLSISCELFEWSFKYLGIFFILTELFSNFEKLALIGLILPTKLLTKINTQFHEYYFGNEIERKKALESILSKDDACKNSKFRNKVKKVLSI